MAGIAHKQVAKSTTLLPPPFLLQQGTRQQAASYAGVFGLGQRRGTASGQLGVIQVSRAPCVCLPQVPYSVGAVSWTRGVSRERWWAHAPRHSILAAWEC